MEPRISLITLGVSDLERAYRFYHRALGFPAKGTPESGIVFFETNGTRLALYPLDKLAEDACQDAGEAPPAFSGVTLAHVARSKVDVDELLSLAADAGGRVVKPAQDVFWGGYSGYFADPDGHLWEVAYADFWQFNPDGSLVLEGF
ncbi:VOC family protein [Pseudodesulfovibrio cashew]|uniref:VOC family protein n=1 Tax=Pseudodesulfovibrio cashew TaxID=2678688 RepID=A0A6I6JLA4_9BACT|nr:VOC family protein [Pseudodesulfovibrio cashew]QGY41072.1 VOC family protein [Pseudodesulfovibrio cashew]